MNTLIIESNEKFVTLQITIPFSNSFLVSVMNFSPLAGEKNISLKLRRNKI